eukprot:2016177-Pyramimonas_sp.AAC.1
MDIILAKFKRNFEDKGFVHIPGHQYYALLLHFGALPRDLQKIEDGRIHKHVGQDREETMSFRQIAFHRVLLTEIEDEARVEADEEKAASLPIRGLIMKNRDLSLAGCESVTSLSDTEICSDAGAKVYFERSGPRRWNMPPFEYANSSLVPGAIARILDHLQLDMHDDQGGTINTGSNVTINDQILIRVNKTVAEQGTSEPTPEGIHQDATEISSVTNIGRKNVARDRG